jgi:hypothetical protein
MKTNLRYALSAFVLMIAWADSAATENVVPSTMSRVHDTVLVPGELLSRLSGASLDSLRLYAFRDGAMRPIMYQFDERLPNGVYVFTMGSEANADQANRVLDPQDMLILRISDTGDRAPRELWPVPDGLEIELKDPLDGGRSYCYLLRFSEEVPERVFCDSMSLLHENFFEDPDLPIGVNSVTYTVSGIVTHLNNRTYKNIAPVSFSVPESAGGAGIDFIDGLRVRIFVELFFGSYRIDINERNIIGGLDQIHLGNVRGYCRQWNTLLLPFGIEGPRLYIDVFTYDRMLYTPVVFRIPFNPGIVITRGGMTIGFDLNENAHGMRLYTPTCMDGVTIDGKMSEIELSFPDDWIPWYVFTGPQGTMVVRAYVDPALLEGNVTRVEYTDDLNVPFPPEDSPGSMGYARGYFEFTDVEPGIYPIRYEWHFPPNFYDPDGLNMEMLTEIFNIVDEPLIIRVDGREAVNQVMTPPLHPKKKK